MTESMTESKRHSESEIIDYESVQKSVDDYLGIIYGSFLLVTNTIFLSQQIPSYHLNFV